MTQCPACRREVQDGACVWPKTIVSRVRLLDGRFRDPLIGRDILIGIAGGVFIALLHGAYVLVPSWFGVAGLPPDQGAPPFAIGTLGGLRQALGILCLLMRETLTTPMASMVLLLLCRVALRRDELAIVAVVLLIFPMSFDTSAWFAGGTLIAFAALGALAIYGFPTALAGWSAFGDGDVAAARAT